MPFKKGYIPWNKGKKLTEEAREKLKGHIPWNKGLPKDRQPKFGKKHTEETKSKISNKNKGLKRSEETKTKISEGHRGEKSYNWKGGISIGKNFRKYKLEHGRKWRRENREKYRFFLRQRHYREKNANGSHTFGEWELLKKQYGYICPSCKKSEPNIKLTEDHIIPLSKGGSNYIENIQPLCLSCNSKKQTKIIKF